MRPTPPHTHATAAKRLFTSSSDSSKSSTSTKYSPGQDLSKRITELKNKLWHTPIENEKIRLLEIIQTQMSANSETFSIKSDDDLLKPLVFFNETFSIKSDDDPLKHLGFFNFTHEEVSFLRQGNPSRTAAMLDRMYQHYTAIDSTQTGLFDAKHDAP